MVKKLLLAFIALGAQEVPHKKLLKGITSRPFSLGERIMDALLQVFHAVQITQKGQKPATQNLLRYTLQRGFVFAPEVLANYSESQLFILADKIGLSGEQINSTFHKSWQKVKNAPIEQLFLEQLLHYFTTYGFESLGIYDTNSVYLPQEQLDLSDIDLKQYPILVIHGYTQEEIKIKLLKLLQSGIALHESTIQDVVEIGRSIDLTQKEIEQTKNREVKCAFYDAFEILPEHPMEFLRYLLFVLTGKTLLIKDRATLETMKQAMTTSTFLHFKVVDLLLKYKTAYGLSRLAEIFYRFKPLFLALRLNSSLRPMINKIRKLAKRYHKPMQPDVLNSVTAFIKRHQAIDQDVLQKALDQANPFRKIRLLYALRYRMLNPKSILYVIRNGRGYATNFPPVQKETSERIIEILETVLRSFYQDVRKHAEGKKIYCPGHIHYALPVTEKRFTGPFPSGTYISIPHDMIVGVHWTNVGTHRIDLDVSMISPQTGKIGWDSSYRTTDRAILFSGDMTDAPKPKGASELFYVKRQEAQAFLVFVNYYNYSKDIPVPFEIVLAQEHVEDFQKNYMINPAHIVCLAPSTIAVRQKILGLLITTPQESRFYFAETALGRSITSSGNPYVEHSRQYLFAFYQNTIGLKDVLQQSGAIFVENSQECDIDLSPGKLEKDTLLQFFTG